MFWGPCRGIRFHIFHGYSLAYLYGGREHEEMEMMIRHVKPGAVVYDFGANYGLHTLLLARLAGPGGRVFALEPSPEIYPWLTRNVGLNGWTHVTCLQKAISNVNGRMHFDTGAGTAVGHLSKDRTGIEVETVTLDSLVESGFPPPDMIKVDVEGAESLVLAGAMGVLRKYRPVLLVELHNPDEDVAVGAVFAELGYRLERLRPREFVERLDLGWPNPKGVWGTVLATPKEISAQ